MRSVAVRNVGAVLLLAAVATIAEAQYSTGFEPPTFNGSSVGVVLAGQDGFYRPTGNDADFSVYTFGDNPLGIPANPAGGGTQFVAGRGEATAFARAQRDVEWGSGLWRIAYDVAVTLDYEATASDYPGSFAPRTSTPDVGFIQLFSWTGTGLTGALAWRASYLHYLSNGAWSGEPGLLPGAAWDDLEPAHWYRLETLVDRDSNRILEASIRDLSTSQRTTAILENAYLEGGAGGPLSSWFAFRLYTGGESWGNITAWDNLVISQGPALEISKTGPAEASTGTEIVYTLTYGNSGGETATDVVVVDPIPAGTHFVSASGGGELLDSGAVRWRLGDLAAGASGGTLELRVAVDATSGRVVNQGYTISASGLPSVEGAAVVTEVFGAGVAGGPEVAVSEGEVGRELATATDRNGIRVVAWRQSPGSITATTSNLASADLEGVVAQLFDVGDEPLGEAIEIDADLLASAPSVAFDARGDLVTSWRRGNDLLARAVEDRGERVGPVLEVASAVTAVDRPRVVRSFAGNFTVVWRQGATKVEGGGGEVMARFFAADGSPRGEVVRVDAGTAARVSQPSVSTSAGGEAIVVWQEQSLYGLVDDGNTIVGQIYGPDGGPEGGPTEIADTSQSGDPVSARDADGDTVVVWSDDPGEGTGSDVFARLLAADGSPRGASFRVNTTSAGEQENPAVAMNAAGDIVVVWESRSTKSLDDGNTIVGAVLAPDGEAVSGEFPVAETSDGLVPVDPEVSFGDDDTATVAYTREDQGGTGRGVFFRTFSVANPPGSCTPDATTLCLNDDRFQVRVTWRDFADRVGLGEAVTLTDDTGYFWFFNPANVEMILKVLDGTALNGRYWVFYGALSNVEYAVTVTDVVTGSTVTYFNPSGTFASVGDTVGLPGGVKDVHRTQTPAGGVVDLEALGLVTELARLEEAAPATSTAGTCVSDATTLCLNQERFAVSVEWEDFGGRQGSGQAVTLTGDTGYLWFFSPDNVELVVKVLDGRPVNGSYWVFFGALSNIAYTIKVTDTVTDEVRTYENPMSHFGSVGDTSAFPGR